MLQSSHRYRCNLYCHSSPRSPTRHPRNNGGGRRVRGADSALTAQWAVRDTLMVAIERGIAVGGVGGWEAAMGTSSSIEVEIRLVRVLFVPIHQLKNKFAT